MKNLFLLIRCLVFITAMVWSSAQADAQVDLEISPLPPLEESTRRFLVNVVNSGDSVVSGKLSAEVDFGTNTLPQTPNQHVFSLKSGEQRSLPFEFEAPAGFTGNPTYTVSSKLAISKEKVFEVTREVDYCQCRGVTNLFNYPLNVDPALQPLSLMARPASEPESGSGEPASATGYLGWNSDDLQILIELSPNEATGWDLTDSKQSIFLDCFGSTGVSQHLELETDRTALEQGSPGATRNMAVYHATVSFSRLDAVPHAGAHFRLNFGLKTTGGDTTGTRWFWKSPGEIYGDVFLAKGSMAGAKPPTSRFPIGIRVDTLSEPQILALSQTDGNAVTYILPWAKAHPDLRQFDERERLECRALLDLCHKHNLKVLLQLGMYPEPQWLLKRYRGIEMRNAEGVSRVGHNIRVNPNHPALRSAVASFARMVKQTVGNHPALLACSLWPAPTLVGEIDYSPATVRAFRKGTPSSRGALDVKGLNKVDGLADILVLQEQLNKLGNTSDQTRKTTEPPTLKEYKEDRALWLKWMRFRRSAMTSFFDWYGSQLEGIPLCFEFGWEVSPLAGGDTWETGIDVESIIESCDAIPLLNIGRDMDQSQIRNLLHWARSVADSNKIWATLELGDAKKMKKDFQTLASSGATGVFVGTDGKSGIEFLKQHLSQKEYERKVSSILSETVDREPEVALYYDWNTVLQTPGNNRTSVELNTFSEILNKASISFDYVCNEQIESGALSRYRVIIAAGAIATSEKTLEAIDKFYKHGGTIIATAHFGARNEKFEERPDAPRDYFGLRVDEGPRKAPAVDSERPFPITWTLSNEGYGIETGTILFEKESQVAEYASERVEANDGRVLAEFADGSPAIVQSERTLYVAFSPVLEENNAFSVFLQNYLRKICDAPRR